MEFDYSWNSSLKNMILLSAITETSKQRETQKLRQRQSPHRFIEPQDSSEDSHWSVEQLLPAQVI